MIVGLQQLLEVFFVALFVNLSTLYCILLFMLLYLL